MEMILDCVRRASRVTNIARDDWRPEPPSDRERFIRLVARHGVGWSVASALQNHTSGPEFRKIHAWLHNLRSQNAVLALTLLHELYRIVERLRAGEIRCLVVKGLPLSQIGYGDLAARRVKDLDLLVSGSEFDAAVDLLHRFGYRDAIPQLWMPRHVLELRHPETGNIIDLHRDMMPLHFPRTLNVENLWARRARVRMGPVDVDVPGIEDTVVLLAAHGAKHGWVRLEWLLGFSRLALMSTVNWDAVMGRSRQLRYERAVRLAVNLSMDLLQTPMPDWVERWSHADRAASKLSRDAGMRLRAGETSGGDERFAWSHVRALDSGRDGLRYLAMSAWYPSEGDELAIPRLRQHRGVMVCARPVRLAGRVIRRLWTRRTIGRVPVGVAGTAKRDPGATSMG